MTRLYDQLFSSSPCAMSSGDRTHARSRYVTWERSGPDGPISWHTDGQPARLSSAPFRVKWLLEPRDNHPENFTVEALDGFSVVYTHDAELLATDGRARDYVLGGTRIHESDWGQMPAGDRISIVASPKRGLPGHVLRHDLIATCGPLLDAYGPEYTPIREKWDALRSSAVHVAIEPVQSPHYISEHLIDALLTLRLPIYWGASKEALIAAGFEPAGILLAPTLTLLRGTVEWLSNGAEQRRIMRRTALARLYNFRAAIQYAVPEDHLYRRDPSLFGAAS